MRRLSAYQSWWVWRSRPQYRSWKQERSGQNPLHWRVAVVFGLVWAALVNFSLQSNASPPESIQKETKRLCLGHKNPTKLQVRLWLCFLFKSTTVQSTGNYLKNLTKTKAPVRLDLFLRLWFGSCSKFCGFEVKWSTMCFWSGQSR